MKEWKNTQKIFNIKKEKNHIKKFFKILSGHVTTHWSISSNSQIDTFNVHWGEKQREVGQ